MKILIIFAVIMISSTQLSFARSLCPDGSWVGGSECNLAPNGSWVGGEPNLAPNGSWVGGEPNLAPDGSWVGDNDW